VLPPGSEGYRGKRKKQSLGRQADYKFLVRCGLGDKPSRLQKRNGS
jgi:hypothetical protein